LFFQHFFEHIQLPRQAQENFKIAIVYRTHLHQHAIFRSLGLSTAIACHAFHCIRLKEQLNGRFFICSLSNSTEEQEILFLLLFFLTFFLLKGNLFYSEQKNSKKRGGSMAYDSFVLASCVAEIKAQALDAKINKIHQPGRHQLLLRFYGKNGQGRILLSAEAEAARLHLTEENPANPPQAPLFLMVARKWLEGAVLKKIEQTPYERVATLSFATKNELGYTIIVRLIAEIMGKHSNIILVDEAGLIIDGIRRYDNRLSRYREVLPQRVYAPPPPFNKVYPLFQDEEELAEALWHGEWQKTAALALSCSIAGISPWLARELLAEAGLKENLLLEEMGSYELTLLQKQVKALIRRLETIDFAPCLLREKGRPVDFAAFAPYLWQEREQQFFSTMSAALDAYYAARQQQMDFTRQQQRLQKTLQHHITRLQRKITARERELAASEQGESYKEAGDLLAAHLYTLCEQTSSSGRGLKEVYLPSFDEPVQTVCIELDAALTPQQNIQRYYRRYNKCRKARGAITGQLSAAKEEYSYLQSIAVSIAAAQLQIELAEIEREFITAGILPAEPTVKGKKAAKETTLGLPPRSYTSADGFIILVGRNNKQNDRLSLKMAASDDMWLHTQKIPGSHVIIVCEGKEAPDTTIMEAASYAAWFSQARESSKVAVDYTCAAQVKKPAGAKPGMVIYFQQQTVYVAPRQPQEKKESE
jgi:predicted ribosome quality control (RQC) complex YloA/Tae2 family protein